MIVILLRIAGLFALMIALIMGSAKAGTLSTNEILGQFNAVVFGSFTSTAMSRGGLSWAAI